MVEVIFVIVIIGILASVAIPKLAATRNDAKIAALTNNIVNGASEIAAYAVANGNVQSDITLMSNSVDSMIKSGDAVQSGSVVNIKINDTEDCITMEINISVGDSNISIVHGNVGSDAICQALQDTLGDEENTIPLTGRRIIL